MSKSILVGYDPRSTDHAPVHFGAAAAKLTGAPLIVASVEAGSPVLPVSGNPVHYAVGAADDDLLEDCAEAVAEVRAELSARGIPAECRTVRSTSAARALHELAEEEDAGLLVVGSSRLSAADRVLAGSTTQRLMSGAPCPVAVVPRSWSDESPLGTIGVAYLGTEEGRAALRGAHALARRAGARLRALTVVKVTAAMRLETEPATSGQAGKNVEDVEGEHKLHAERELRRAVAELGDDVPVDIDVFVGDPAETIIGFSRHVDLLVLGSRAYGPVRAVLLGSVSRRVVLEAACPVIVLPRGVKASLEALISEAPAAAPA